MLLRIYLLYGRIMLRLNIEMLLVNFTEPVNKQIITNTALSVFWQNKLNCSCYEFDILKVSE